ncbi:hypothetical protein [Paenibacillus glacialis]|uniref:Uncharacterized protein n=1 Tax=Paenibacillus glacialis TaxID=494026 RepID=A0A168DGF0_9BACL|nr:hypothetical protein [Paenibacillus glacialis]OAB34177.1 hypothetical protein PGLA_25115 [Paenibacillus glacialis]
MSRQIQAYFQTEDQAEGAKTTLHTYETEHVEVSKLVESIKGNNNLLLPLVAINPVGSINTAGIMGAGGVAGINLVPSLEVNDDVDSNMQRESVVIKDEVSFDSADDYGDLNYVLVAKVQAEQYDDIVQKLREHHAYVEKID